MKNGGIAHIQLVPVTGNPEIFHQVVVQNNRTPVEYAAGIAEPCAPAVIGTAQVIFQKQIGYGLPAADKTVVLFPGRPRIEGTGKKPDTVFDIIILLYALHST
jgi:hypothetical protein